MILLTFLAIVVSAINGHESRGDLKFVTTADRIMSFGYPVQIHDVETTDGYILTMFRIPYSPRLQNEHVPNKPVFYLQHGFISSSDCFILNGPDNALAYLLADAGYDVWLGNSRGNTYSRQNQYVLPIVSQFWQFSWNEVGTHDLPAMVDYVLYMTGEDALHYVGHSQGTTAFLVFLSTLPSYNAKMKTTHLLAPVGYMKHMKSPFARILAPLLGYPTLLSELVGGHEFMPTQELLSLLESEVCADASPLQAVCANVLFLIAGFDPEHLNTTLLPQVVETHPAGSSSTQLVHYIQEFKSGYFRQFDHGLILNMLYYNSFTPPDYVVENIRPSVPVQLYYGDNDFFSAPQDVLHLANRMADNAALYHVEYPTWNHFDYLWAKEVKEVINDRIIGLANEYESTYKK